MTVVNGADAALSGSRPSRHFFVETPDTCVPVNADVGLVTVGISGARRNAAVAIAIDGRLRAFCEQERLTRVRGAALDTGTIPKEALETTLAAAGESAARIRAFVTAEEGAILPNDVARIRVEHHYAHAATAALTSSFTSAAVLVCDHHSSPQVSVWRLRDGALTDRRWPWCGSGLAALYSEAASFFGFGPGQEHQLEALARLDAGDEFDRFERFFSYHDACLWVDPAWKRCLSDWIHEDGSRPSVMLAARVAASFQRRLGQLLVAVARDVRADLDEPCLCLAGGLFYNTYFNTIVAQSRLFEHVFVPSNPGNAGTAAGAALAVNPARNGPGDPVSPFLGPKYDLETIKETLDNCKLSYDCLSESDIISSTVDALSRGKLVGWFQGRMEWGHRALGHRSILANPFSPYVLENLNVFLKRRDRHRAYGLSVPEEEAPIHFDGPARSRFMEFDYEVKDRERFRHVLPSGIARLRVQTVGFDSPVFRDLHRAVADATSAGVLVHTSFNGFHEPIVCCPRDAVRVFFGTGLDLLVLDRFIIHK